MDLVCTVRKPSINRLLQHLTWTSTLPTWLHGSCASTCLTGLTCRDTAAGLLGPPPGIALRDIRTGRPVEERPPR